MANAGEERSSRENGPAIYETFEKGVKNDAELTTTILGTALLEEEDYQAARDLATFRLATPYNGFPSTRDRVASRDETPWDNESLRI